jgi:LacI family transcriptional regulator
MPQRARVTIHDVARRANVSVATISRVLNNSTLVAKATRDRIQRIAKELRYVPNASARGLSTHRSEMIGLLLPDMFGEFFSEVIRGADQKAQENHYHLLVSSSHNNREEIEAAISLMRGRVDGLIIMSPHTDSRTLSKNLPRDLPVMLLNCSDRDRLFNSLNIDNYGGAYEMVRHLLEHGHRRIAIIKGTEHNLDAEERLRGYRKALQEQSVTPDATLELVGNFTDSSGYEATRNMLANGSTTTAIFASNDSMAIGALSALREAGVQVPGEIALAGFDDIPTAAYLTPSLTSVRTGINNFGALAMQQILLAVKSRNTDKRDGRILPATLSIRESCGCLRKP